MVLRTVLSMCLNGFHSGEQAGYEQKGTMMLLLGYDAAYPPANPPDWPVCGFYIGGNTPHAWTDQEIAAQPARWYAPLWVTTPDATTADADRDAPHIIDWLHDHHVPNGRTVWIDTETWVLDGYLIRVTMELGSVGYKAGNYGSLPAIIRNPLLNGGRWSADWNNMRQLDKLPGVKATQFADSAMLGRPFDGSVWGDESSLWDSKPSTPPPHVTWEQHALDLTYETLASLDHLSAVISAHLPRSS